MVFLKLDFHVKIMPPYLLFVHESLCYLYFLWWEIDRIVLETLHHTRVSHQIQNLPVGYISVQNKLAI